MLTPYHVLKDVIVSDRAITVREGNVLLSLFLAVFTAVITVLLFMDTLIKKGISGLTSVFNDELLKIFLIWMAMLILMFMHGYIYACQIQQAVRKGKHFNGTILKEKMRMHGGAFKWDTSRIWVQLDNDKVIKAPEYIWYPEAYQLCDVYFYHHRYYFTEFRYRNGSKSWRDIKL